MEKILGQSAPIQYCTRRGHNSCSSSKGTNRSIFKTVEENCMGCTIHFNNKEPVGHRRAGTGAVNCSS